MSQTTFDERLFRINHQHRRTARGVIYRMRPDGLLVAVPRRRVAPRPSLRAFLIVALIAYAFKAALFVGLGEGTYVARLDLLAGSGTAGEAVTRALQPDPVMRVVAMLAAEADLPALRLAPLDPGWLDVL